MAIEFNFTVSKKELLEKWSKQCSLEEWKEVYMTFSGSFSSWDIDLKLAEFIIKRVKEGYIDKYRDEDIPQVLKPLLIGAMQSNIIKKNEENLNVVIEEVIGEHELEAIKVLRNYNYIDYNDAIDLFCNGYDYANRNRVTDVELSNISTEDLLEEIKNRM